MMYSPITRARRDSGAFATLSVILLLVLIAAAIAAISAYFAHQSRRTSETTVQAQLRQLLLAATPAAQAALRENAADRMITLPTPVQAAVVTLRIQNNGEVEVMAILDKYRAGQTLHFVRGNNGEWTLTDASLTRTQGQ